MNVRRFIGFESGSIAIVMIVTFCLSFGVMWWQRKSAELSATEPRKTTDLRAGMPPIARPAMKQSPAIEAVEPHSTQAGAVAKDLEAAEEMPVEINFHRRARLDKIAGRLMNSSSDSLAITVKIQSPGTQRISQLLLDLAPNRLTEIGMDDGLDLHSGDQVTLQSPAYPNKVAQIP